MNVLDRPDAHDIHDRLVSALRTRRTAAHAAAMLLRQVADHRLHHTFGFASVYDYAEQRLDLTARQTRDLLQMGGALPDLPELSAAFAAGDLSWTKVREVVRVATPETDAAWTSAARENTSRVLERQVAHSRRGDPPHQDPGDPRGLARRRVVFELETSDAAVLHDALALLQAEARVRGEEIDQGAALAAMAQRVILDAEPEHAPTPERYRVVIQRCPGCGVETSADADVSETVSRQACCDAEIVDLEPGPTQGHLTRTIPPATRRAVMHRDEHRCVVPGCRCRLWLDLHHLAPWAQGGGHEPHNLVTLCSVHHRLVHEGILSVRRLESGEIEAVHPNGRRSLSRRARWSAPAQAPTPAGVTPAGVTPAGVTHEGHATPASPTVPPNGRIVERPT